jgi:hypothetical protein
VITTQKVQLQASNDKLTSKPLQQHIHTAN